MIHNGYQATHGKNDKDLSKGGSLNYTFLKNIKDACKVDILRQHIMAGEVIVDRRQFFR